MFILVHILVMIVILQVVVFNFVLLLVLFLTLDLFSSFYFGSSFVFWLFIWFWLVDWLIHSFAWCGSQRRSVQTSWFQGTNSISSRGISRHSQADSFSWVCPVLPELMSFFFQSLITVMMLTWSICLSHALFIASLLNKIPRCLNSSTRGKVSPFTWREHSTLFWEKTMALDFTFSSKTFKFRSEVKFSWSQNNKIFADNRNNTSNPT